MSLHDGGRIYYCGPSSSPEIKKGETVNESRCRDMLMSRHRDIKPLHSHVDDVFHLTNWSRVGFKLRWMQDSKQICLRSSVLRILHVSIVSIDYHMTDPSFRLNPLDFHQTPSTSASLSSPHSYSQLE